MVPAGEWLGEKDTHQSTDDSLSEFRQLSCLSRSGSEDPEETLVKTCSIAVEKVGFASAVVNTGFISPLVSFLRTGRMLSCSPTSVTWGKLMKVKGKNPLHFCLSKIIFPS